MKVILPIIAILALLFLACEARSKRLTDKDLEDWDNFKREHGKKYKSTSEDDRRSRIFVENKQKIKSHNKKYAAGKVRYQLGMNRFGDLKSTEFKALMVGVLLKDKLMKKSGNTIRQSDLVTLATPLDTWNWTEHGAVTPVKDQGSCGSCYTFSVTGTLEGVYFKNTGKLYSLSEQQLMDCSRSYGNAACNGGQQNYTYEYIMDYGIETEAAYPYTAKRGTCKYNASKVVVHMSSFKEILYKNETDMKWAIYNFGPVSVSIYVTSKFQLYKTGIFEDSTCKTGLYDLNHAVVGVGFGKNYFLLKNSWGTSWGERGYMRIVSGKNMCGIATDSSYPVL